MCSSASLGTSSTSVQPRKRDFALDAIKALAIYLVCQTHYMHFNTSIFDNFIAITSCMGVPLFFMVNGALLLNRGKCDIHRHYQKTLRIILLCALWKLLSMLVQALAWNKDLSALAPGDILSFLIGKNTLDGFELGHFWYLYALVGIYCIYPLLKCSWDSSAGRTATRYLLGIIAFFTFGLNGISLLWGVFCHIFKLQSSFSFSYMQSFYIFGTYGYCIVWFLLGGELYEFTQKHHSTSYLIPALCTFGAGWLLLLGINRFQNLSADANCIVIDGYFSIATALMCVSLFYVFCTTLKDRKNRLIQYISQNTWGIYMLHMLVGIVFLKIQFRFNFPCGIVLNTVKSIWMIAASLLIIWVAKKIPLIRKLFSF